MNRSKKYLLIALIITILLAIGFFGYLVYDKYINKTDKKTIENNQNEIQVINLITDEEENLLNVFDGLIISNWGNQDTNDITTGQFDYFKTDLSRMTAVFYNNNFVRTIVSIDSGSGEATCYNFSDLNNLSLKVFGQGINHDNIEADFGAENWNCPLGYVGMETGFTSGPRKIKELKLNKTTEVYTIEIIPDTEEYEDYNEEELNAIYRFNFKIDDGIQLKDLKFINLTNLSGEKNFK